MTHVESSYRLAGAQNFRDFGGYAARDKSRIKSALLFRSGRLSDLTADDERVLQRLGPRTIFDLRRQTERDRAPTVCRWQDPPDVVSRPLIEDGAGPNTLQKVMADPEARTDPVKARAIMLELYRLLTRAPSALSAYKAIFLTLSQRRHYPIIVHCSGGKDRTGIVCALIQGALGVSQADIVADYMISAERYGAEDLKTRIPQMFDPAELGEWSLEALAPVFTVEPAYIETSLDTIQAEHGSLAQFLTKAVGIPPEILTALAENLLE